MNGWASSPPREPVGFGDRSRRAAHQRTVGAEFQPEKYEDEYRQRLLKAIEQKIAGQEIQRVEVETRPPTTDLVATLEASLGRKDLAKVSPGKARREPVSEKRPARRKRAS
jgi:DNA end-binding protein Ku